MDIPHEISIDPLIRAMFERLPEPNTAWPPDARRHWVETMEAILDLIYGDTP